MRLDSFALASSLRRIGLLLPLLASFCFGQFSAGVQGNVSDSTGQAIPGANVTLLNTATNLSQVATSDPAGVYRFLSLQPGRYTITATAKGFSSVRVDFVLQTAENRDVPLRMSVGDVTTNVTVTSQAALLDTSDTRNSYTLNTQALETLPLANRNPIAVLGVAPGVTGGLDLQNNLNYALESFVDATANGRGQNGNSYVVDGLDVTSNNRPGVITMTPNSDSVQEVAVQLNTYSVEYAGQSGISTVLTTKSGADQFHAYASEYYTYQGLRARGIFGPDSLPSAHTNNMSFGGGGPILRKQRLYFFASLQPYLNNFSSFGTTTFEDPAFVAFAQQVRPNSPEVQLFSRYPVGGISSASVQQTAQQAFGPSSPGANTGCATPSTNNIPCDLPVLDTGDYNQSAYSKAKQYNVRIDKYFEKDRLYGTFIRNTQTPHGANSRPAFNNSSNYYGFAMQGNETHTFNPSTLNEAYFGYNRTEGFSVATGTFSVPVVNVTGVGANWGNGFAQGDFISHSYHWRDVLSHIAGSHSLKLGYEGWHGDDISLKQAPYSQPTFQFNNLIDLIDDRPYSQTGQSYNPVTGQPQPGNYGYAINTGGGFAEDTWKVSKSLTINYGMRYDDFGNAYPSGYNSIAAAFVRGYGATLAEQVANGSVRQQGNLLGRSLNWNFSPRVGAAWDIGSSGNWVVRAGFGVYPNQVILGTQDAYALANPPNFVIPTFFNNGSTAPPVFGYGNSNTYPYGFPYPAFQGSPLDARGGIQGSQISVGNVDVNATTPRTYTWSAALSHPVTHDLVASIGYTGSHSANILLGGDAQGAYGLGYDVNAFNGDLFAHTTCEASGSCSSVQTRLNPSFGAINYAYNASRADYHSLIVSVKGRFARSGFVVASYTRSIAKDNANYYFPGSDLDRFYGNSPFDFPNRFSLGLNYQFPSVGTGFLKHLTSGWSLSGTLTLQSGSPMVIFTDAPLSVQRINPALPPSPGNLQYRPSSGDFAGTGYNYSFPNIDPNFKMPDGRQDYLNGVFPKCASTNGSNLNNCGSFSVPQFGQEGNERINDRFRNPAFAQTDASLARSFRLWERLELRLRLDAFNLFNQVNFNSLDQNASSGTFGQATSTHTPRYLQVGGTLTF